MARITVEDCLDRLPNRFSLVLATAERAKQLLRDGNPLVENEDRNKEVVVALREIAAGRINVDDSSVDSHDQYLPLRAKDLEQEDSEDELPPEADDELPPEADDELPLEAGEETQGSPPEA